MEMKKIILIFVILLAIGASAFYFSGESGYAGKFTGAAILAGKELCYDFEDNDNDALVDCADPGCDQKACDTTGGCMCTNMQAREVRCWDNKDNDNNGLIDMNDPHCILIS